MYINEVKGSHGLKTIQTELMLEDIYIDFKLDTGAECNILPKHIVDRLNNCHIQPTNMQLKSFGGYSLDTVGKCRVNCKLTKSEEPITLEFYVIRNKVKPLLGLESCLNLGLVTVNNRPNQNYASVCNDVIYCDHVERHVLGSKSVRTRVSTGNKVIESNSCAFY